MRVIVALAIALTLMACNKTDQTAAEGTELTPTETSASILYLAEEIGVELGDSNFVFGVIQDVDFTSEGNIAVLDGQKKRVKLYSQSGDFIGDFGGAGEAPGEFLNPHGIACLSDNRIAVTDPFSREVEIFGTDLEYIDTFSDFTGRAPFVISSAGTGFAGEQGGFDREAGILTTSVALWETGSEMRVFSELTDDFSPENMIQRIMMPSAQITSDSSNIYYSAPVSEEYIVSVYPLDGSESYNLSFPDYTAKEKSEEDLELDIQAYEYRMQGMASAGRGGRLANATYDPPPFYYATGAMGIDNENNIWVQRGWESNPTFDIFPEGATTPTEIVIVDPELDLSGYSFVISPNGIAAFNPNPEDYPKVLILNLN